MKIHTILGVLQFFSLSMRVMLGYILLIWEVVTEDTQAAEIVQLLV